MRALIYLIILAWLSVLTITACDSDDTSDPSLRMTIDDSVSFQAMEVTASMTTGGGLTIDAAGTDSAGVSRAIRLGLEPQGAESIAERQYALNELCTNDRICLRVSYLQQFATLDRYQNLDPNFVGSVEINISDLDYTEGGSVSGSFSANLFNTSGSGVRLSEGRFTNIEIE